MQNFKKTCALIFSVTMMVFFSGCDSRTVNPLEESGKTYSIYGALSTNKNPNYVRVRDLSIPFFPGSVPKFGGTVMFENIESGTTTTLRDTVVEFSGNYTDNFIIEQPLKPKTKYRLTVTRSDGKSTSSVVTVPGITQTSIAPSQNVSCDDNIVISFKNVAPQEGIRFRIGAVVKLPPNYVSKLTFRTIDLVYPNDGDSSISVTTHPNFLLGFAFQKSNITCKKLYSNKILISYTHFGPEWVNFRDAFTGDPTKSLDVDGGLGFLGAFRRDTTSFTADTTSAS